MSRYRIVFFVAATLSATLSAYACGDGTGSYYRKLGATSRGGWR